MMSVDQTIVSTALPAIQRDLDAKIGWAVWTITVYALGQVLAKPLSGRLNDRLRPRRLLLLSITVFTVASLCCGLAPNIETLIAMRFVQALGGGAVVPAGSAIISDVFGKDRDRALGMFTTILPVGAMIGPIAGGLIVSQLSWRWIFLVNLPLGATLVALAYFKLPRTSTTRPAGPTDVLGVVLVTAVLASAMVGITEIGSGNGTPTIVLAAGCLAAAVVCGLVLGRHVRRHPNPVISPNLLAGQGFGTMNLINFLYGCTALGLSTLVPLYAERRYGLPPLQAGSLLTARAIGMVLVSGLTTFALRRIGYRLPMFVGSLFIAGGLLLMALPAPVTPTLWLAITAAITGIGMGTVAPASNNATLYLAPSQLAEIVGLRGTFRQSGSITAVSVTTAIVALSPDPGLALAYVFVAFAAIVVATLPLLFRIDDHKGEW